MKVLIVGGGGREHALAWKVAQSPAVERVYVAPGNAGTAMEPGVENVAIGADEIDALVRFSKDHGMELTIVGPEAPLVAGIVDAFRDAGLPCFGPTRDAAILEGSKSFTKDFLKRHGIPTAAYASFSDIDAALAYIRTRECPVVIKADGLAAGKGVVVARTEAQAVNAATEILAGNKFGSAGNCIVVEEFLQGEEASFIVMCDGEHILPLASSQDHKARDDGDTGPNTGGMGAYSPAPVVTAAVHERIMQEVIVPTVRGMAEEGRRYTGFLYAGLMIAPDGTPRTLEFNCRFGDPETQPIMMRLHSDLVHLCLQALSGKLDNVHVDWDARVALGVVLASAGYPESAGQGEVISGLSMQLPAHVKVFHAGSARSNGRVVTAGGRVLCVVGMADTVSEARQVTYDAVMGINWSGMFYRRDIGYRALARE
jgi:phosphoribosylamine--glycine ligase